ncbi:MAG TPA: hypothetical protein VG227_01735 [Caulobacteraceae bacterium]|nr:hypothetical protein [Caulobacteraceae bacterium]
MTTTEFIIIVLVVALVLLAAVWAVGRRKRTERLRGKFGPEYGRAVEERGGPAKAEEALHQREKRVEHYDLKPLSPGDRRDFGQEWERLQAMFVDSPKDATTRADALIGHVMSTRGYPEGPFDQRLEDLSVEHAEAVQGYRAAHEVALRRASGEATTEDMRQAMIGYRRLLDELLGANETMRQAS